MQNRKLNKIISGIFIILLLNCANYKNQFVISSDVNDIRKNIIIDFAHTYKTPRKYLKKRNGKSFDVFWVTERKIYDGIKPFSIIPETDGYVAQRIGDKLGEVPESYFPNNFIVKENMLFIWKDTITPLTKNVLNILNEFEILDSTDIKRELKLLPENFEDTRLVGFDDGLEGVNYFVCANNILKYKKVVSNLAFGYFKLPKLNCN